MANSCNKLMNDAIDIAMHEFKGIELNYKLEEVLGNLKPSMKFTAEQLKGYLLKQGVSPNEITASKIFEGFEKDNRALPISDWNNFGVNQKFQKREQSQMYEDITLGHKGVDNSSYKVNEFITTNKPDLPTNLRHEMFPQEHYDDVTQLGWNRVHFDTINGKGTTILNELQSDWMQAERQGAGIFESKIPTKEEYDNSLQLVSSYFRDNQINPHDIITGKVKLPPEIDKADKIVQAYDNGKTIADFPLKPEKFQQLMIVDALNEAINNKTMRVAIPTIRHGNDLVGTEGVTKFYQDLNKKVLPDIRSKLEKQGLRLKISSEDYKGINSKLAGYTKILNPETIQPHQLLRNLKDLIDDWEYLNLNNYDSYPFNKSLDEIVTNGMASKEIVDIASKIYNWLSSLDKSEVLNKLHILEIEEVPNAKVKWNVYGLLSSIGLGAYASKSEASDNLVPNKAQIETEKPSKAIEDTKSYDITLPERVNPANFKADSKGIKDYIANIETRGYIGNDKYNVKSKTSSAEGKYQILPANYAELSKNTGIPINKLKDPHNQEKVMDYLIGEYKATLEKWNLPASKENIFVMHNLGQTGGARVLRGNYEPSDIKNMAGQLAKGMDKSSRNAIITNYNTMYNVDIPLKRRA